MTFRPEGKYRVELKETKAVLKMTDSDHMLTFTIMPKRLVKTKIPTSTLWWDLDRDDVAELIADESSNFLLADIRKTITVV